VVRGKPDIEDTITTEGNLTIIPFQTRAQLSSLLSETEVVIARSGYTTLMDLARTGHKVILCPTPGQYEQIYLGDRLAHLGQCVYKRQEDLDLALALKEVQDIHPIGEGATPVDEDYSERLMHLVNLKAQEQHEDLATG
jgi:predicted glycosyltransferase